MLVCLHYILIMHALFTWLVSYFNKQSHDIPVELVPCIILHPTLEETHLYDGELVMIKFIQVQCWDH